MDRALRGAIHDVYIWWSILLHRHGHLITSCLCVCCLVYIIQHHIITTCRCIYIMCTSCSSHYKEGHLIATQHYTLLPEPFPTHLTCNPTMYGSYKWLSAFNIIYKGSFWDWQPYNGLLYVWSKKMKHKTRMVVVVLVSGVVGVLFSLTSVQTVNESVLSN